MNWHRLDTMVVWVVWMVWLVWMVCVTLAAASATAQESPQPSGLMYFYTLASQAEAAEQYREAFEFYQQGLAEYPDSPHLHLALARTGAVLGEEAACLQALERFAALGATVDLAAIETLAPLLQRPGFREAAGQIAHNGVPPAPATIAANLQGADLWTEGIAYDPATGDLFAGSVKYGKIVRISSGQQMDFGSSASDGLMEILGLDIDAERRRLWAVAGRDEGLPGGKHDFGETPRQNAIVVYDLDSGHLLRTHTMIPDQRIHMWNDISVAPDGTAYFTDMTTVEIYRIAPGGAPEVLLTLTDLNYPNGLVVSDDGNRLYIAGLETIVVVDLPDGEPQTLVHDSTLYLGLGDGLALRGQNLFAVQNNALLGQRILRCRLGATGKHVVDSAVMSCGLPSGLLPYTCALGPGKLYVNGTASFDLYDQEDPPPAPVIVELALDQH